MGGETTGQTQPVCVSTSVHRIDSHEEDRGKSERRRRREGLQEAKKENKQFLTSLGSALNRTSHLPAVMFPAHGSVTLTDLTSPKSGERPHQGERSKGLNPSDVRRLWRTALRCVSPG